MSTLNFDPAALAQGQSWIDWCAHNSAPEQRTTYDRHGEPHSPSDTILLGHLIQAAAEQPVAFTKIFEPVMGGDTLNPLRPEGEGALYNLLHNGVHDDFEIYIQWREDGYVVVMENDRQPSDSRLSESNLLTLLNNLTFGQRMAPGEADTYQWVQDLYQNAEPKRHWRP